jgi:anhydro-N-acetylmuramic acid kinase
VATLTALTATSIVESYAQYCGPVDELILSGGGARNPVLRSLIAGALGGVPVRLADELGIDGDAKEAVAFAVLGHSTLHGWPNSLPSATGARAAAVLGSITPGANYRALLAQVAQADPTPPQRILLERNNLA